MKITILTVLTLAMLTGCSQEKPGTEVPSHLAGETPLCPATTGYAPFPKGVNLDLPYHLRSDRIVQTEKGQRRRLVLEYLEGDVGTAYAGVAQSLAEGGFQNRSRKDISEGAVSAIFSKKDFGLVHISINSDAGSKPSNPTAKGVIRIGYPTGIPPVSTAVAEQPPALPN